MFNAKIFKSKLGVRGIEPRYGKFGARVHITGKGSKHLGFFDTIEEAIMFRNNYIKENNLPNPLSEAVRKAGI
jgi:hypothetical protein